MTMYIRINQPESKFTLSNQKFRINKKETSLTTIIAYRRVCKTSNIIKNKLWKNVPDILIQIEIHNTNYYTKWGTSSIWNRRIKNQGEGLKRTWALSSTTNHTKKRIWWLWPVSYTHLDVYKRQVLQLIRYSWCDKSTSLHTNVIT